MVRLGVHKDSNALNTVGRARQILAEVGIVLIESRGLTLLQTTIP